MAGDIEATIFDLLAQRDAGKTICPSEVARALQPEGWHHLMSRVRGTAVGLARQGRLVITRKGKPVDPNAFKGIYRLRLPDGGTAATPAHEDAAATDDPI